MTLFLTMLPIYLLGNLHCLGMCGPLVMMLGNHRYKYWYFLGRLTSFSLAAMVAGFAGMVLNTVLEEYHLSALLSVGIGSVILFISLCLIAKKEIPGLKQLSHLLNPFTQKISLMLMIDKPITTFLFGFFTVALPCGQTLLVYSACALYADAWVGLFNGFAFALLTSPSLFFAMKAQSYLNQFKQSYNILLGGLGMIVGILALCRGFADLGWISHLILSENYHIVIY